MALSVHKLQVKYVICPRLGSGDSKHTNIEYFISAQKIKTYLSSDWKKKKKLIAQLSKRIELF